MDRFNQLLQFMFQMRGIGELLEGIIPYSQRHFSRMDRLIRGTYLLDYTLTGMSVIEPETDAKEIKDEPETWPEVKDSGDRPSPENADEEQEQTLEGLKEKASLKKRKSRKSGDRAQKKVKETAYTKISAISLQA